MPIYRREVIYNDSLLEHLTNVFKMNTTKILGDTNINQYERDNVRY